MTWNDLLAAGRVETHVTSKQELDDLRSAVRRNLRDAALGTVRPRFFCRSRMSLQ